MHILFLDPVRRFSTREHELQVAAARSHAAKMSHHRAEKRRKTKITTSDSSSTCNAVNEHVKELDSCHPEKFDPILAASIFLGFGSFRSELLNLLPNQAHSEVSRALAFFVGITLPGIDVANEMFDNSGIFAFLLPNLVTFLL